MDDDEDEDGKRSRLRDRLDKVGKVRIQVRYLIFYGFFWGGGKGGGGYENMMSR